MRLTAKIFAARVDATIRAAYHLQGQGERMVVRLNSGRVEGVDAYPVELEVDFVRQGLPGFTMVGLAEAAVREAKDGSLPPCVPAASSCPRRGLR